MAAARATRSPLRPAPAAQAWARQTQSPQILAIQIPACRADRHRLQSRRVAKQQLKGQAGAGTQAQKRRLKKERVQGGPAAVMDRLPAMTSATWDLRKRMTPACWLFLLWLLHSRALHSTRTIRLP